MLTNKISTQLIEGTQLTYNYTTYIHYGLKLHLQYCIPSTVYIVNWTFMDSTLKMFGLEFLFQGLAKYCPRLQHIAGSCSCDRSLVKPGCELTRWRLSLSWTVLFVCLLAWLFVILIGWTLFLRIFSCKTQETLARGWHFQISIWFCVARVFASSFCPCAPARSKQLRFITMSSDLKSEPFDKW